MLVSSLIVLAAMYGLGVARLWHAAGVGKGISRAQTLAFAAGWITLAVALVGPLHEMSESLLSAHMVQHELLMIVAAPLIALSSPFVALMWLFRRVRKDPPYVVSAFRRTVTGRPDARRWYAHFFR
jgi:cytochrome c oxidase assembly factor CtaG